MRRSDIQLILLSSLSLVPDNTLRYTALGSAIALTLVYNIHLNLATWLHQLEQSIQQTEEFIEEVKCKCPWPRDHFRLTEERVRLLEVKRSASEMHCSVLAVEKPTWKKYWFLKRNVAECANRIRSIHTAVQLVLESEIQRRLTEDIEEIRSILMNAWPACSECQGMPTNQINMSGQSVSAYSTVSQA